MSSTSLAASFPISRAMVLGAGMGSRMGTLTSDRPKPMVEVAGRALIDHVLDRLADAGICDVVVNVHYRADVLEDHLKHRTAPAITVSDERDTLLDTGGGVARAVSHFGAEPFFIHNADTIWQERDVPVLETMMNSWDPGRMDSLLLLADPSSSTGYSGAGDFVSDATGVLRRRRSEDNDGRAFAGVSIAHSRMFEDAPSGAFSLNVLWDRLIASNRLSGVVLEGRWMHVGTPEAVAQANDLIAQNSEDAPAGRTT